MDSGESGQSPFDAMKYGKIYATVDGKPPRGVKFQRCCSRRHGSNETCPGMTMRSTPDGRTVLNRRVKRAKEISE